MGCNNHAGFSTALSHWSSSHFLYTHDLTYLERLNIGYYLILNYIKDYRLNKEIVLKKFNHMFKL